MWLLLLLLLSAAGGARGNACDDSNCQLNAGGCLNPNLCQLRSSQNPTGSEGYGGGSGVW